MSYTPIESPVGKVRRRLSTERKSHNPALQKAYNKQPTNQVAVGPVGGLSPKSKPILNKPEESEFHLMVLNKSKARTPTEKIKSFGVCPLAPPTTPPPTIPDKYFRALRPELRSEQPYSELLKASFSRTMAMEYFAKEGTFGGFHLPSESPVEKHMAHLMHQRTDRGAKVSDFLSDEYCMPKDHKERKEANGHRDSKFHLRIEKVSEDHSFKKLPNNISPTHLQTCSTLETIHYDEAQSPFRRRSSRCLRVDDFTILKEMGSGTFGRVVMVRYKLTGFLSALKIIPKKMILEKKLLPRLINELKIQAYLSHPNIIQLYGSFHDHDNIYVLMELGSEGQLYTKLKRKERYSEYGALLIIRDLLASVNHMHSKKLLHRDIKPENIVVVHGTVKLCDFGWAVYRGNNLRNTFCGTPLYISPEQLSGKSYDEKVDLWAIGILSFELVVGRIPFQIEDKGELSKILTDEVLFPPELELSDSYRDFVLKILTKDPKSRMTAAELLKHGYVARGMSDDTNDELCAG